MGGYEVARAIRALPGGKPMRPVAVSGYDTVEARTQSAQAGFDQHVCKPIDMGQLEALMRV